MRKPKTFEFNEKTLHIKEALLEIGIKPSVFENIPADFYRLNKSQLRRIAEYACDSFISEMFNVTQKEVKRRRHDFGLKINSLLWTKNCREKGYSPETMAMLENMADEAIRNGK